MKQKVLCGIGAVLVLAFTAGVSFGQFETPFSENFDDMDPDKKVAEQSAWETWFENEAVDAFLVDDPVRSKPFSVEMGTNGIDTDLIAQFTDDFGKGCYDLTAYWWVAGDVPSPDTYFIIQSIYEHNGNVVWVVQCHANGPRGTVICDGAGGGEVSFAMEKWVEVKVRVNWNHEAPDDISQVYFDGVPISDPFSWTDRYSGGNPKRIATLDLYARTTCCAYYDDITFGVDPQGCLGEEGVPECLYEVKRKPKAKGGCENCPAKGDLISNGEGCDPEKRLKDECAKKFKPKNKTIECPDGGNGICKKMKLKKRNSCDIAP